MALGACAGPDISGGPLSHGASPGNVTCLGTSSGMNGAAVRTTNATRSRSGLSPLQSDTVLAKAAAQHACDMARLGRMSHRGSATSSPADRVKAGGYRPRLVAENIAAGPYDMDQVLRVWTDSPGHLGNIMIPQLRDFGIGQAIGADGRTRYWTAVYATPE
ncbi:CAP domain-containing protein [Paracoccus methylarcula]|uniref:CAP domain-containing protein n=2 Tax=Paracoccus methylarcula TaxID=72022 RepID=A0A3R7LLU1_9RHOB|nr:CAP domain-containing protein [Paracoccus methylarcula]